MRKKSSRDVTLAKKVDVVVDWLFGDHGPFGWNDPARFQDAFNRASKAARVDFVADVVSGVKKKLLEKV